MSQNTKYIPFSWTYIAPINRTREATNVQAPKNRQAMSVISSCLYRNCAKRILSGDNIPRTDPKRERAATKKSHSCSLSMACRKCRNLQSYECGPEYQPGLGNVDKRNLGKPNVDISECDQVAFSGLQFADQPPPAIAGSPQ